MELNGDVSRDIMPEEWWFSMVCPLLPAYNTSSCFRKPSHCYGSGCAFWVETRVDKDTGVKYGVCTK